MTTEPIAPAELYVKIRHSLSDRLGPIYSPATPGDVFATLSDEQLAEELVARGRAEDLWQLVTVTQLKLTAARKT